MRRTALGKLWIFVPLGKAGRGRLLAFVNEKLRAQGLHPATSLGAPRAQTVLATVEGKVAETMERLRHKHPGITLDLAANILHDLGRQIQAKEDAAAGK